MKKIFSILIAIFTASFINGQVSFTADNSSGCTPLTVNFISTVPPNTATITWNFGDGGSSNLANPSHTYISGGYYQVQLIAYDNQGAFLGDHYYNIDVFLEPSGFQINQDSVCIGDEVSIWYWSDVGTDYTVDYGDGSSESSVYGSFWHTYSSPGTYAVTFTYITDCGNYTYNDSIFVGNNVPVSGLSVSPSEDTICPGDEVYFNTYSNSYGEWFIDFGDGNTGVDNSQHTYAQPGTYDVLYTFQNSCGNVGTANTTITVSNNLPFSAYVYASYYTSTCPNEPVEFYTTYGYANYEWNFHNNPNLSTTSYATNSYVTPGTYPYSVTITNGCGNDTTVNDSVIIQSYNPINSYLDISIDTLCLGEVLFYDVDGDDALVMNWDMGDGTYYAGESGQHEYGSVGNYAISLYMQNGCGNDTTLSKNVYIGSNVPPNPNLYGFQAFPNMSCLGDSILFLAIPGGGNTTFEWDFGDGTSKIVDQEIYVESDNYTYDYVGHAYASLGTYTAVVTAENACGLSYTDSIQVQVTTGASPQAGMIVNQASYNCLNTPIEFLGVGGSQMEWDFGDNSGTLVTNNTLSPVYHTYTAPGTYSVKLKVINECGLSDIREEEVVIQSSFIEISTSSVNANCGFNDGTAIASVSGGTSPFIVSWSNTDSSYIADSLVSGIYQVNVVDANGCKASSVATVSDNEAPTIVVNTVVDVACAGGNTGAIDINVIGSTGPYTYSWSNGASTEDVNNLSAGPYEILVTDANGCVSSESINVNQAVQTSVTFTSVKPSCENSDGIITANVNGNSGPYTFVWSNGMNSQTIGGLNAGIYTVNVIDNNGCLITETYAMSEQGAPVISIDSATALDCGGQASIYTHAIGGAAPYSYLWSNNTTTDDLLNVDEGVYYVNVTDSNNCSTYQLFEITESTPDGPQICVVSVEPVSNKNLVVWDKTPYTGIESFNIYKESSASGVYFLAGNVHYDSLSQFIDPGSDPEIRSWRYKIAAVDNCGNESVHSLLHKTIHLTSNIGVSGEINLIWSHYEGVSFSTYNIWRYSDIDGWNMITSIPNNLNSYTDAIPPAGAASLHYYVEAVIDAPCFSTRANHNQSRSNKSQPIVGPIETDINDIENSLQFGIYPNPSNGIFNIRSFVKSSDLKLTVYDMNGREVKTISKDNVYENEIIEVDLQGVSKGVYNISIRNNDNILIKRLIIQ